MRIHHLNCGSLCPLLMSGLPSKRAAAAHGPDGKVPAPRLPKGQMVCHCLLLELRGGLALVDTGLGTQDVAAGRKRLGATFVAAIGPKLALEETAWARVQQLGFTPQDVRHILPTHLDLDHAGGLPDFPEAQVHLYEPEHTAAMARRSFLERDRYRPAHWEHGVHWKLHNLGGERWMGFDAVRALPGSDDEVLVVPLIGHTRGHAGIAVKTDNGWLLHAGDAYFYRGEIHATPPRCPLALDLFQRMLQMDGPARVRNQARLRELATTHKEVTIFCAHDPRELERAVTRDNATA